jgi:peptidoglycan/xylan/chitin deacetylase (PgdA/CDA1 family)
MYHGVGGQDGVSVAGLERQLEALRRRRRVVPLTEALEAIGQAHAGAVAAITFDDGYRDFAEFAVPILRAARLFATLFVPAGWIGRVNGWDAGSAEQREILTSRELRGLDPAVISVGAHGLRHRRLTGLGPADLHTETTVAKDVLEQACGRPVTLFAYPYGQADDFDTTAERAVAAAGFVAACSTRFGRGSRPAERFRLRRLGIEPGDSLEVVEGKFDGAYDWIAWKEALGTRARRWRHLAATP